MDKKFEIIICVGIPGSGKSTWSHKFVSENPSYIRINRDSMRGMFKEDDTQTFKMESLISEMEEHAIICAFNKGFNIVLDNTHTVESHIKRILEIVKFRANVTFKIFDISLEEAILRDSLREKLVGELIIKDMKKKFDNLIKTFNCFETIKALDDIYVEPVYDPNLEDIYVFDLDGTIFHHNDQRSPFDWLNVDNDTIDNIVADQVRMHKNLGHKVFIVSGRDDICKRITEGCLIWNDIPYDKIFMRTNNDMRKDSILKKDIYETEFKGKYNIKIWYDDRNQVVNTMRKLGIKVFQVSGGNF